MASAKRRVFGQVGIDMIAGPSEILVLADGSTPPEWVAMDLFSQAEHDELAQSILLCPDAGYIQRVSDVFVNNGAGVRGDLKAVVRAILLDPEARQDTPTANQIFATGAAVYRPHDTGRVRPYLLGGGGVVFNNGSLPTADLLGVYTVGTDAQLGGTDSVSAPSPSEPQPSSWASRASCWNRWARRVAEPRPFKGWARCRSSGNGASLMLYIYTAFSSRAGEQSGVAGGTSSQAVVLANGVTCPCTHGAVETRFMQGLRHPGSQRRLIEKVHQQAIHAIVDHFLHDFDCHSESPYRPFRVMIPSSIFTSSIA